MCNGNSGSEKCRNGMGNGGRRIRRYRAAVYAVCGSVSDVDKAFDRMLSLMLSERRERYLWGVMLDHAPSPLFRTFGDREIEDRMRERFEAVRSKYPGCGFFCVLRGRRYGGDRGFRCEKGMYGALRRLACGNGDGFTVRLSTGDGVERSDRMFVYRSSESRDPCMLPGAITLSEAFGEAVLMVDDGMLSGFEKRRCERELFRERPGNCRVCGWFPLIFEKGNEMKVFKLPRVNTRSARCGRGGYAERLGGMVECAEKCFVHSAPSGELSYRPILYADATDGAGDIQARRLVAAVSLHALSRIDTVILRNTLSDICLSMGGNADKTAFLSPGASRIALLVGAAVSDSLGARDDAFYALSRRLYGLAEELRMEYELGRGVLRNPFSPCEMIAYRSEDSAIDSIFCGFAAFKRVSDWLLYALKGDRSQVLSAVGMLVRRGFGKAGVAVCDGFGVSENTVLLALCAELETGVFSRMVERSPELSACSAVLGLLPELERGDHVAGLDRCKPLYRKVKGSELTLLSCTDDPSVKNLNF